MRATYLYGAGDVRVIDVPDPTIRLEETPQGYPATDERTALRVLVRP